MYIKVEKVPEKVPEMVRTAQRCVLFACQKSLFVSCGLNTLIIGFLPRIGQKLCHFLPVSKRATPLHTHILTCLKCPTPQHKGIEFKLGGHWLLHTQRLDIDVFMGCRRVGSV